MVRPREHPVPVGRHRMDDKWEMLKHVLAYLKPIQEKRKELAANPQRVEEIIAKGRKKHRPMNGKRSRE